MTVSINASRRRLRTARCLNNQELEMLVDQNSRMYVREWTSEKSNGSFVPLPPNPSSYTDVSDVDLIPLDRIVELSNNNVFRCCFMFGDFFGQNCEDAYVFNSAARPRLDNMVQLKLNFYRSDKLLVSMDTLRFHFEPHVTVYSSGAVFYFGSLFSCHRLSFGSTFVHVKTIRISDSLWLYKFYYINNASYLRESEAIFHGYPDGCQFVEREQVAPCVSTRHSPVLSVRVPPRVRVDSCSPQQSGRNLSNVSFCSVLEHELETRNGMIRVHFRMTNKQLRFLVQLRNVRSVQKWQNSCGNKGVSACRDLSDLYTLNGGRIHVIVSAYSTIGRQLVAQMLEQFSCAGSSVGYDNGKHLQPVFSKSAGHKQVGWCGYGDFFFSCDSPHDTIIVSSPSYGNNATRMCNMTYYAAIGNNLSTWIANRSANHVNYRNNPINGMPLNISRCLSVYHHYNRQLYSKNLLVREYRRKRKDHDELLLRGISSSLPSSFPCFDLS